MSILLIAEHDNSALKVFTLNAIYAASKIDTDIHVLVAGNKSENVVKEVAAVPLVKKVLHSNLLPQQIAGQGHLNQQQYRFRQLLLLLWSNPSDQPYPD